MNGDETSLSFAEDLSELRELAVPEHVVSYVAAQRYPKSWQRRHTWHGALTLVGIFMCLILLIGGVLTLARHLDEQRGRDALFLSSNHGLAAIPLVFAAIFLGQTASNAVLLRLEPRRLEFLALKFLFQETRQFKAITTRVTRWMMRRVVASSDHVRAERFFLHYVRWRVSWDRRAGLWILAFGLFLLPIDLGACAVGTAKGVEKRSVFGDVFLPWSELQSVAVGCFALGRRGPFARYELSFADGTEVDAWPKPRDADTLAGLRKLDRQLRARGIRFERGRFAHGAHAGELQWSPGCTERLHTIYPAVATGDLDALLSSTE
ncbi:MAG TPA: hypothetical protein VFK05_00720 [Polyangiaceae bacterium]|nr:hypothetical protein [Polyangiaceae bacterium]